MGQVHKHSHSVIEHCVCLLPLFCSCGCGIKFISLLWQAHKKHSNDQQNISFEMVTEDSTRLVECTNIHIVYWNIVFPSYHPWWFIIAWLKKFWLVSFLFSSGVWLLGILNNFEFKINNFSLGSRTSMVHHLVIHLIPIADEPRVMIPHTYLILAPRSQTLHFGQHVIFPCPKVPFRKCCRNIKKNNLDHSLNIQIPSIYAYGQYTTTKLGTFAILVVWWGRGQ